LSTDWTARIWAEFRAGNLTRVWRDVLLTLRTYRGHGGLICPSHATLAERAKCGVRSVQHALRQARALGLVSWVERRVRAAWRWLRTSNRYFLELPGEPVRAGLRAPTKRKSFRREEREEKKEAREERSAALAEMMRQAAKFPDLLAARREAMKARLASGTGLRLT